MDLYGNNPVTEIEARRRMMELTRYAAQHQRSAEPTEAPSEQCAWRSHS